MASAALILLVNFLFAGFVRNEKTLYAWDHVAYWSMSRNLAQDFQRAPAEAISETAASIWRDEINLLPSVLPALVMVPAGESRTAFILALLDLYSIPALLLGFLLFLRLSGEKPGSGLLFWIAAVLLIPAFWQPLSLGYPGSGGMILAFLILSLAWSCRESAGDDESSQDRLRLLAMGLLLAFLTLFRRWWAFWSLSFCLVWAGELLIRAVIEFPENRAGAKILIRRMLSLGLSVFVFLLLIGGPRILAVARTDYAGKFVHYKGHHGIAGAFSLLRDEFGLLGILILAVAWLMLLIDRKWRSKALFLTIHSLLIAGLFFRVQDPSPQHWYLLMPAFLLVAAAGWQLLTRRLRGQLSRTVPTLVISTGILLSGLSLGLPFPGGRLGPRLRIHPAQRSDIDEIRRLMAFLDEREEAEPGWIYVLAGTGDLPESGLAFINLSLGEHFRSPAFILQTQQVDLRDGFPRGLFRARYVLVPKPPQYRGRTQRVIQLPAEDFDEKTGIASAFAAVGREFQLQNGLKVQVFERIRPNSEKEIETLSRRLRSFYPDTPKVWQYF